MRYIRLLFKIFALLGLFFTASARVLPQDAPVAKILALQNPVVVSRPTDRAVRYDVTIAAGSGLFTGDIIKTKSGGRLVLELPDGSQAIISENTTVEIEDTGHSPRTIFNVIRGRTRIKIEKLGGKPNPYRVTTPTTIIAVRGTMFDVFVKGDKTEVFVTEGKVSVTNFLTPLREVFLLPGQFTRVENNLPPQEPELFKPKRNDDYFKSQGNGNEEHGNSNDGDNENKDGRGGDNGNKNDGDKKDNSAKKDIGKKRGN